MLDLKNRGYEDVIFFVPNRKVCFKMENGLFYLVNFKRGEIYIDATCEKFIDEDIEDANKLPKEQLIKAERVLKTAKLPNVSKEQLMRYEEILRKYKNA